MSDNERTVWQAVRRGLLLIARSIEATPNLNPLWGEVRRGLLLIAKAIEDAV